jgi:1-acyl-sn-glycerol-3-phosphate acyltransferase
MLRGAATTFLLLLNLFLWGTPVLLIGLLKLVTRGDTRRHIILFVVGVAEKWIVANNRIFDLMLPTVWDIDEVATVDPSGRYLIFSNHISWADIFVLQRVFQGRVSFPRFFIKSQLIWFPIMGQIAWLLDFPFMRRYSAEYLERHPEKRGKDLETTRRACARYRHVPVAILNFLEGTRFSEEKRVDQASPYKHLLRPRTGGAAFVLASLGDQLDGIFDVTIAYPGHLTTTWDLVSGRIERIAVRVRRLDIPRDFERDHVKEWIESVWREKDALLSRLIAPVPAEATSPPARRETAQG